MIEVRGVQMTVAQALQRLNTVTMEMTFLECMENQFVNQTANYTKTVEYLDNEAKKSIEKMKAQRTAENPMTPVEVEAFMNISKGANAVALVDQTYSLFTSSK